MDAAPPRADTPLPSLVTGGGLHRLFAACGLLSSDGFPSPRVAVAIGAAAWLVGAAAALLQWWTTGDASLLGFFVDASTYAHALAALPVLIGIERSVDRRLGKLLEHPLRHGLVTNEHVQAYRAAVARADTRSGVVAVDVLLLAVAGVTCALFAGSLLPGSALDWRHVAAGGVTAPSWAGVWMHYAVGGALVFLTLRWLHRFFVWTLLLAEFARLRLALVPTHPDRAGGLGFLAVYPSLYYGPILGVGAALGAELLNATLVRGAGLEQVVRPVAAWLAAILVVFIGPLLMFWPRLVALRDAATLELGGRAVGDNLAHWQGVPDAGELPALNARNTLYDRAAQIQPMLVSRATVGQLLTVALLPMLPALATLVPLNRLLDLFVGGLK